MPAFHFNRSIDLFRGSAAVIGCARDDCDRHIHDNPDIFYSFDKNNKNADAVGDIRTPQLPESLKNRFNFIMTEYLDNTAYNDTQTVNDAAMRGAQGFENLLSMTTDEGFILIVGSPRNKEFRQCMYSRELKYIELDVSASFILIAKNQSLSLDEITMKISRSSEMKAVMSHFASSTRFIKPQHLQFCTIPEKFLPAASHSSTTGSSITPEQFFLLFMHANRARTVTTGPDEADQHHHGFH